MGGAYVPFHAVAVPLIVNSAYLAVGAESRERGEGETVPAFSLLLSPAVEPGSRGQKLNAASPGGCRHCGVPLNDARMRASGFCCAGCSYVFRLVHESGLE